MKRSLLLFWVLLAGLLAGCSQPSDQLLWLTPGEGGAVVGTVELRAQAFSEPFPVNVVFFVGDTAVAKAYEEDGIYNALWDSRSFSGRVELQAKPYGGDAVVRTVTVVQQLDE